ncbi:FAD-binding oxidoreductase [Lentisalinibacter sediminis]|uniref:FAD-binding oxidoreductase n=1 Tax=Lentisalinibacter sediminis TaxID=2992237 RepID=UPI003865F27F
MTDSHRQQALDRIREIVGQKGLVDPAAADGYLIDERQLYKGEAALIVRPASTAEVAEVMATCYEAGLGIVPQGGNTGYCGGATPDDAENQVLISLSRMNDVRAIDPVGFTMTAEAGVILANAQQAAAEHDLLFPLSMASEGSAEIGGILATNAGGLAVLRYGTGRELCLGLEMVLPDGRIIHGLTGLRKDNTGFDLKSLFCGAEGTLGIITAATLKLFPQPKSRQTAWLAVADAESACRLLGRARRESGDCVTSFEYVTRPSLELAFQHADGLVDPLDEPHDHYVLLELSSGQSDEQLREVSEAILMTGMEEGEITDGVIAESGQQREQLWRLRESIPESEKHEGGSVKHDVSVTIDRIPEYLAEAPKRIAEIAECRYSIYGHIGDGNLHYNLLAPADEDAEAFKREHGARLSKCVHDLAAELGGSFSAEHGVGKLKKGELATYKDPEALEAMRAIKAALDPKGLMNPGKVL